MDTSPRAEKQRDAETIRGFFAGDPEASSRIDFWIYSVIRNPRWGLYADTDDIHQMVRLKLLQSLGGFEGKSSLKTYVCRISIYTCVDEVRGRRRRGRYSSLDDVPDIPDPGPGPLDAIEAAERRLLLETLIQMAAPECRNLWRMIYFENLQFDEIALILGVMPGTIKSRASRCREKARAALKKLMRTGNRGRGNTTV